MILSVSRRTDIPCCYPLWFMNRLRAGYVLVRNPMNYRAVSRISLTPQVVDAIVFWTKDPQPFLPYLDELDAAGYKYCFQFTLNPYDREIEPLMRDKADIIKTFIELSKRLGKERVLWRYDPILLSEKVDIIYHERAFEQMCKAIHPYTNRVTISFLDMYKKIQKQGLCAPTASQALALAAHIGDTARKHGLKAYACAEQADYRPCGVLPASCIDRRVIEELSGMAVQAPKAHGQRAACGCMASVDIGSYYSCQNGCLYCYAGHGHNKAGLHNFESEMLLDSLDGSETVTERVVRSWGQEQTRLF